MRKRLSYRRAIMVIATILGLAALGGTGGWLLRNELVKRQKLTLREGRDTRPFLSAHGARALNRAFELGSHRAEN